MHRKADLFDLFHLNPTPLNHPLCSTFISTQTPLARTLQIDGNNEGRSTLYQVPWYGLDFVCYVMNPAPERRGQRQSQRRDQDARGPPRRTTSFCRLSRDSREAPQRRIIIIFYCLSPAVAEVQVQRCRQVAASARTSHGVGLCAADEQRLVTWIAG